MKNINLSEGIKNKKIEHHQTFPTVSEFREMDFFNDGAECTESGVFNIDVEWETTDLYYRLLGDDAVIWYQEIETLIDQGVYVSPNPSPDPIYLFKFVLDQNCDVELHNEEGWFRTKNLILCNSLGSHGLTLPAGYRGKILQMIVPHRFLSEYVAQDYLQHPVIESIVQKRETDILIIDHPPLYLQSELNKMIDQLKGQAHQKTNKLKLLQLTAQFIDSFFRLYLGEIPRGSYLSDQEFKDFVEQYFEQHIYSTFTGLETIAAKLHISTSTFKRRFSVNFEDTPLQYFKKKQMKRAKEYLLNGSTVEEVAFKFSFSSVSNFIRCFKSHYNCTPGNFIS